jgi:hypothetical protein
MSGLPEELAPRQIEYPNKEQPSPTIAVKLRIDRIRMAPIQTGGSRFTSSKSANRDHVDLAGSSSNAHADRIMIPRKHQVD